MSPGAIPADDGLLARFRSAGTQIAWRPAKGRRAAPSGRPTSRRIAHLNDEEATVEQTGPSGRPTIVVDSGPLGALVLLLEIDRRGAPTHLVARTAGERAGFDQGALQASWGRRDAAGGPPLPVADLVGLARYALA